MQGVEPSHLLQVEVVQLDRRGDVEWRLVCVGDQGAGLGGDHQYQVQMLELRLHAPIVVPTAQHAEEVGGERGIDDPIELVHGQHQGSIQAGEDLLAQITVAVTVVTELGAPGLGILGPVVQVQLQRKEPEEAAIERVRIREVRCVEVRLNIDVGDLFACGRCRCGQPLEQGALADLARTPDGQGNTLGLGNQPVCLGVGPAFDVEGESGVTAPPTVGKADSTGGGSSGSGRAGPATPSGCSSVMSRIS